MDHPCTSHHPCRSHPNFPLVTCPTLAILPLTIPESRISAFNTHLHLSALSSKSFSLRPSCHFNSSDHPSFFPSDACTLPAHVSFSLIVMDRNPSSRLALFTPFKPSLALSFRLISYFPVVTPPVALVNFLPSPLFPSVTPLSFPSFLHPYLPHVLPFCPCWTSSLLVHLHYLPITQFLVQCITPVFSGV